MNATRLIATGALSVACRRRNWRPLARHAVNMLALAVWLAVGGAVLVVVGVAIGG
jgi:hypothetical protein